MPTTETRNPDTGPADGIIRDTDSRLVKTKGTGSDDTGISSDVILTSCKVVTPGGKAVVEHVNFEVLMKVPGVRPLPPNEQSKSCRRLNPTPTIVTVLLPSSSPELGTTAEITTLDVYSKYPGAGEKSTPFVLRLTVTLPAVRAGLTHEILLKDSRKAAITL